MKSIIEPGSAAEAVWRGFTRKCPNCGRGRLFGRFLKVVDHCPACGEELFHHRADDFPPYLVIMIVGHAIVPAVLAVEMSYAPAIWLQFLIWLPVTLLSALVLLQPVKGAIVGMQWQLGMHGFALSRQHRLATTSPAPGTGKAAPGALAIQRESPSLTAGV